MTFLLGEKRLVNAFVLFLLQFMFSQSNAFDVGVNLQIHFLILFLLLEVQFLFGQLVSLDLFLQLPLVVQFSLIEVFELKRVNVFILENVFSIHFKPKNLKNSLARPLHKFGPQSLSHLGIRATLSLVEACRPSMRLQFPRLDSQLIRQKFLPQLQMAIPHYFHRCEQYQEDSSIGEAAVEVDSVLPLSQDIVYLSFQIRIKRLFIIHKRILVRGQDCQ